MGGAANRFFTLLSTTTTSAAAAAPVVLLRRSTITTTYSSLLFLRSRHPLSSPSPRRRLHSRSSSAAAGPLRPDGHSPPGQPWPEWSRLLDALSAAGYFDRRLDSSAGDELSPAASPEFARAAAACLEFARERAGLVRLLSSRDVEVVVGDGTPLSSGETAGLDIGKVSTVDLMKFILSYVSNLVFPSENSYIHNRELVESSVRKLLHEMAKLCYVVPDSSSFEPMQGRYADGNGEPMRPAGPKIEMKRGDWICPRCSFMNFARNMKCLECEETRPKTQLSGGEWECPQCDFFNYGRNKVCLRCDCKRPGEVPIIAPNTRLGTGYESGSDLNRADIDSRLAENEEKAQRWFSKISQLDSTSDPGTAIADDDFPEIMPLRKGVNRFVVSTRKTPLERRLANSQYQTDLGNVGSAADGPSFRPSSVSPQYGQSGGRNSTYVPFVPLPADMFAKKPESSEGENRGNKVTGSSEVVASNRKHWASSGKSEALPQKPSSQVESNADKEQVEKSDRWFQKVMELHRGIDHASASPDGDFPETMPMRKGENRFVLSKQKDRSLTSPAYKRQMAMEQASDTKFVPFVPFPPDYFAKKDDKPQTDVPGSTNKDASETTPNSAAKEKFPQTSDENKNLSENFAGDRMGSNGISDKEVSNKTPNLPGSSGQPFDAQSVRESWAGKSLEGSAVKEPDPLDMSEEAKAERWFRRVAQIKDISELSQIPDEDFPSIMPMRKGVNRFVVSKRKSPLERRLTSPQYRRNLPTVNSDPLEKDSEST